MKPLIEKDHDDFEWLLKICCGDEDAAHFLFMFFKACHLWDDLIDKDVSRTDDNINEAFWIAFVGIPRNRYYQKYSNEIVPVMDVAIHEWFAANELELEEVNRRDIAYTLRCSIVSLIHQAAELCGGYDWSVTIGPEIRLKTQSEPIDEYIEDLKCQT